MESRLLFERAKARTLKPEGILGGTTTLSNLGMLGVKSFLAIINPPQATILAVGASEKRVVVRNDAPAVGTVLSFSLSADHRALDGATAAELLRAFRSFVEGPMRLIV
jgi:pyruvate dehydrogenase E2 component (dihydrolipoamide acetyltransferase)